MAVSNEEREAMNRLLKIMSGEKPAPSSYNSGSLNENTEVELAGPGAVTRKDVDAMANILNKLQTVSSTSMISESTRSSELTEAIETSRDANSVKVGKYQIMIHEDQKRLAGKQYYSIYHSATRDVIANDISLYETALAAIRLLNNGKYANSVEVRRLFEHDDSYTAHKVDAILYKRRLKNGVDPVKQDIYESRYQASVDKAMVAKRQIKAISDGR
jgi:hypothetical protein